VVVGVRELLVGGGGVLVGHYFFGRYDDILEV
jgi:hypothetical protein